MASTTPPSACQGALPWAPHILSPDATPYRIGIVALWLIGSAFAGVSVYTFSAYALATLVDFELVAGGLGVTAALVSACFLKEYIEKILFERTQDFKYYVTEAELSKLVCRENFGNLLAASEQFAWTKRLLIASNRAFAGIVKQKLTKILEQIAVLPTLEEQCEALVFLREYSNLSDPLQNIELLRELPDDLRKEWIERGGLANWDFINRCPHKFVDALTELGLKAERMSEREFTDALRLAKTFTHVFWALMQRRDLAQKLSCFPLRPLLSYVADIPSVEQQVKALNQLRRVVELSPHLGSSRLLEKLPLDLRKIWIISNGSPNNFEFYFVAPDDFIKEFAELGAVLSNKSSFCLPEQLPSYVASAGLEDCRMRFALFDVALLEETMRWSRTFEQPWECARGEHILRQGEGKLLRSVLSCVAASPNWKGLIAGFYAQVESQQALVRAVEVCEDPWGRDFCLSLAGSIAQLPSPDLMHLALRHPKIFVEEALMEGFDQFDWRSLFTNPKADHAAHRRLVQEGSLISAWMQRASFILRLRVGLQSHFVPLLDLFKCNSQLWTQFEYAMNQSDTEVLKRQVKSAQAEAFDALTDVVSQGRPNILEGWHKAGLSLDIQCPKTQKTLLHVAVESNLPEQVRRLLRLGASPHIEASNGLTPMGSAFATLAAHRLCAIELAPFEKASTAQRPRLIKLIRRLKSCRADRAKMQGVIRAAEQAIRPLDPERLFAVAAMFPGFRFDRSNSSQGDFLSWQRLSRRKANAEEQLENIAREIGELERLLSLLAAAGPVHRPEVSQKNLVVGAIKTGASLQNIANLLHHGGSFLVPGSDGSDPLTEAYKRGDPEIIELLKRGGARKPDEPHTYYSRLRLIIESSYHQTVDRQALEMLEQASPEELKRLASFAVDKGSAAVFAKFIELRPEGVDLARAAWRICDYERLATCAESGLVTDTLRLEILNKADLSAFVAVGVGYPKGSLQALLSGRSNLQERLVLLGEAPLSRKAAPRVAQFLESTLPDQLNLLTNSDLRVYYDVLLCVAPGLTPIQSAEDLCARLKALRVCS